jgi:hypothetical protein
MDDMDIVDFDQNRGRIELAANADQLDAYLDPDTSSAYWYKYYASTSLVGTGLFGLSHLGAASYGLTPTVVLVALLLAVFAVSVLHYSVEGGRLESLRSMISPLPRSPLRQ